MITKNLIESGMYGHAVADALGVPFEFKSRVKMRSSPCCGMVGHGTHDMPCGTWSDDTGMNLALADGLAADELGDYSVIMERFVAWFDRGEYTVDGLFDVGNSCAAAIVRYERGEDPVKCGGRGEYDNGNGSLMRMLPAALYSIVVFGGVNEKFISDMSALTHGHEISAVACNIYSAIVSGILSGVSLRNSIIAAANEYGKDLRVFDRLRDPEFFDLEETAIKSTGYVVDTLEAALWCLCGTNTYKDCVIRAVNLGGDTDTVAAVAGSIAGLIYGKSGIPSEWLDVLRGKNIIDGIVERFSARLGAK